MYAAAEQQANVDYANSYHMHVDGPIQPSYPIFEVLSAIPLRSARLAEATVKQGLFRRSATQGSYTGHAISMQMRNVKKYAREGGVGLNGIKIRLIRDKDLVGRNVFGYAHPNGKMIDLYPDAFQSAEMLIRTLGHERTHIFQFSIFGAPANTIMGDAFERAAFGIEDTFIHYWKLNKY
jgi:hypothetical protein